MLVVNERVNVGSELPCASCRMHAKLCANDTLLQNLIWAWAMMDGGYVLMSSRR
jgi:hypothetical protein